MAVTVRTTLMPVLFILHALATSSHAIHSQERTRARSLVRRDAQHSVHLGPSGNFIEHQMKNESADEGAGANENADEGAGANETNGKGQKLASMKCGKFEEASEQCNIAFAYGNENKNTCLDEEHHLICTPSVCEHAAEEANLTVIHWNNHTKRAEFQIPDDFFDDYPKGCFRAPCANDACIFFNGDGDNPAHPVGYPVCSRPRYVFGKDNTNSTNKPCPHGYNVIDDITECSAARQCLGMMKGDPFKIANGGIPVAIDRMDYPDGCFRTADSTHIPGMVYFNPVKADDVPSRPVGTPLCRAPNELKLPSASS